MNKQIPVVGLPACVRHFNMHDYHIVSEKYLRAIDEVAEVAGAIIPSMGNEGHLSAILDRLDGILIPGSPSDIEPHNYGQDVKRDDMLHDSQRDSTTLPLVRMAIERKIPILGICRGIQEMNVALGGNLFQAVHNLDERIDHRAKDSDIAEVKYGLAHEVDILEGGLLDKIVGKGRFMVNSIHGQGIDNMANGLFLEAKAPDGQIEAVSVIDHPFALGVQWHPEWLIDKNPVSRKIFNGFADAVRARMCSK